MDKFIIFTYHRGGSHLLLKLLMDRPGFEAVGKSVHEPGGTLSIKGNPVSFSRLSFQNPLEDISERVANLETGFYTSIGEWWGQAETPNQVPDPYSDVCLSRWGPDEMTQIPGDNWTFFVLVRDPRFILESLRGTKGWSIAHDDPYSLDLFHVLCKSIRNKMLVAKDNICKLSSYHFIRFEDLVESPVATVCGILETVNLVPDIPKIKSTIRLDAASGARKVHSSFGQIPFRKWTKDEHDVFNLVFGSELEFFRY